MSTIILVADGETEVRITVNAPRAEVLEAVKDIAKELGLFAESQTDSEIIELVAQATKNWWFDKVITQKSKQIEAYSEHLAEETKANLIAQLNDSPLRGA